MDFLEPNSVVSRCTLALFPHLILAGLICVFHSVGPQITLIYHQLTRWCAPLLHNFPECLHGLSNEQRQWQACKDKMQRENHTCFFLVCPNWKIALSVELHMHVCLCWLPANVILSTLWCLYWKIQATVKIKQLISAIIYGMLVVECL